MIADWINKQRKALVALVAVATALLSIEGIPDDAKKWIGTIVAVLASYGITYAVPNKQVEPLLNEDTAPYTGGEV